MKRIRSALFLDFDNIFGGLMQLDRQAALALAEEPGRWLDALATRRLPAGQRRDLLVRRAYLNPAGYVYDMERGNDSGRLYLSRFRPNLTQSGFEVVDCPALTYGKKNAADIRIVIDVLQSLDARPRYNEFIVASSDADFTPLLQRLRAGDRRTTIISAGTVAPAYRNIANIYLDATDLVDLLLGAHPPERDEDAVRANGTDDAAEQWAQTAQQVRHAICTEVSGSAEPVLLANLGQDLRHEFDHAINRSDWFGTGSLGAFVRVMGRSTSIRVQGHYVWDADRHAPPDQEEVSPTPVSVPQSIAQICRITDLPRLEADSWRWTFEALALYAANHDFNLTECTAWTRDQLSNEGFRVGRAAVGYIVRGAMYGGTRLDARPPPHADDIREALIRNTLDRAQASSLNLTDDDENQLRDWLSGEQTMAPEP